MVTETRYKISTTHTVNTKTCYKLITTAPTGTDKSCYIGNSTSTGAYFGIQAFVIDHDGSLKQNLTSGTTRYVKYLGLGGTGYYELNSNAFLIPVASLDDDDAIQVDIKGDIGVNPPTSHLTCLITDQVTNWNGGTGATQLDSVYWNVYYWIYRLRTLISVWPRVYQYDYTLVFGSSTHDGRILNFQYTIPEIAKKIIMDGLVCIVS